MMKSMIKIDWSRRILLGCLISVNKKCKLIILINSYTFKLEITSLLSVEACHK